MRFSNRRPSGLASETDCGLHRGESRLQAGNSRNGGPGRLERVSLLASVQTTLGTSPMAYVAVRRVDRAKLMMASTGQRLTDIALACGFADQSHLNRYFRRIVGVSPGLWRRVSQYETRAHRRVCEDESKKPDPVDARA